MFWSEIDSYGIVLFESGLETGMAVVLAFVSLTGLLLATYILYSIFIKNRHYIDTPNNLFIASLSFSGFFLALTVAVMVVCSLVYKGWALGSLLCSVQSQIIMTTEIITLTSLLVATVDLYLILIWQKYHSIRFAHVVVLCIWVVAILLGFWGLFYQSETLYFASLQPSKLICLVSFFHPATNTVSYLILIYNISLFGVMVFCNSSIFYFYFQSLRRKKLNRNSTIDLSIEKTQNPLSAGEKKLLMRSLVICCSHFFFTLPYMVNIAVQMLSKTPSSSLVDGIITILFGLFYICIAIWILIFDNQLKVKVDWSNLNLAAIFTPSSNRLRSKQKSPNSPESLTQIRSTDVQPLELHWSKFMKEYTPESLNWMMSSVIISTSRSENCHTSFDHDNRPQLDIDIDQTLSQSSMPSLRTPSFDYNGKENDVEFDIF